jgi:zinc protease
MMAKLTAISMMALTAGTVLGSGEQDAVVDVLRRENDRIERFTLDNGLECLLKADASAPVVSVQFRIGCGSMHEDQYLGSGISHAIEHMLFKGTPTRAPGTVTREINEAGGRVNAYTSLDRTVYFADLPATHWKTGFDVLADAVMNAAFPDEEWKLEREVILREVAMGEDSPERVLGKVLWQTAFRTDTRRHPVIGYPEVFSALTREDLLASFKRHYTPDNTILVIVGDIDTADVRAYITGQLAGFKRRRRAPVILPDEPPQVSPRFERLTGDYEIGRLAAAWPSVDIRHPDAPALDILAAVAGQGRSSRLHRSLVEDRRLLHHVSLWSYTPGRPGLLGLSATFDPAHEEAATAALRQEIEYLKTVPFTDAEVAKAVRSALTEQIGELATMNGQAARFGGDLEMTGDPRFSEGWLAQISRVTPDQLTQVARKYLDPSRQSLVLLVPRAGGGAGKTLPAVRPETPTAQTLPLANGATLVVREDHRLPFVHIALALQGGTRAETAGNSGITTLMAELLLRGTTTRSREQTALAVESLGATLNAYAGYNAFGLTARCLREDAETLISLMADCLTNPLFEQGEIDRQRVLQIATIRQQAEQPMHLAGQQLRDLLFAGHPYRLDPQGTQEAVSAATRDDLVAHHRRLTKTGNLAISIFGAIRADEARLLAETAFAGIQSGEAPVLEPAAAVPALPARREQDVPREQAIVMAGFPGVTVFDTRQDALDVLQTAMSGLSSELALEIRDKRGLAYFTGAMQQAGIDPGMFALYAGTRRESAAEVESLFLAEIQRLTETGLRDDELTRAKAQLIAGHAMRMQNTLSIAQECALNVRYGLGADYLFTRPGRIAAVTAEDVRDAARLVFAPGRIAVSVILPSGAKP